MGDQPGTKRRVGAAGPVGGRRQVFTSSGISAGTDMALALIAQLFGTERAQEVADGAEYRWNSDPKNDPFAKLNGLVE